MFPDDVVAGQAPEVARRLLGMRLRSTVAGSPCEGVVVETEAYLGPEDPASHASTRSGITDRNRIMFGAPGFAYVYRIYGMHWCLNVITGAEGEGQGVLIRGVEPTTGLDLMARRRHGRTPIAAGPGRAAQALGVDGSLNGHHLSETPLQLLTGWTVPDADLAITGRVGVAKAAEWPLRFLVRGSTGVSKASPHPGQRDALPTSP